LMALGSTFNPTARALKDLGLHNKPEVVGAAAVMQDIMYNFQERASDLQMPFTDEMTINTKFTFDVPALRKFQFVRPLRSNKSYTHGKQGSELTKRAPGNYPVAALPPPPVYSWALDPETFQEVPGIVTDSDGRETLPDALDIDQLPQWLQESMKLDQQRAFPYPLLTLSGRLSKETSVFPVGESESGGGPPYKQQPTNVFVMFPRRGKFWDLRNALQLFQGERLTSAINASKRALKRLGKKYPEQDLTPLKEKKGRPRPELDDDDDISASGSSGSE
jgi:hypothetical protein